MKTRLIAFVALSCIGAVTVWAVYPTYPWSREWVEQHSTTNNVPKDERLFLGIQTQTDMRGQILCYQSGLSVRTIIDQSVFSNSNVNVVILRAWQSDGSGTQEVWNTQPVFDNIVKHGEKPAVALKPLDAIWLLDTGLVRN